MKSIAEIVEQLQSASDAYYNGDSIITDQEFDELQELLRIRDPHHPFLSKVGAQPKSLGWAKASHSQPMGSLLKIVDADALSKWLGKYTAGKDILWADKLDGLSISLQYADGVLVKAITRGDGEVGDEITKNVLRMKVPKNIALKGDILIRGEMVIPLADWKQHFIGDKNPRNSVSGTSRRLDGSLCEHIQIYAFSILGVDLKTFSESLDLLSRLGFSTPRYGVASSIDELKEALAETENLRADLPYEIDGLVLSENNIESYNDQGDVDNRPKASRAYKFEAQQALSALLDVVWQTGRTGVITPVGILEPVLLAGVTISRATLCNLDEISRLGIGIGSRVIVKRANDVIPKIVSAVTVGTPVVVPQACPSCESPTTSDGMRLLCENIESCPAQRLQLFVHYLDTLGVMDMGEKLVEKLMEIGKLKNVDDLYHLTVEDISNLDRLGVKTATKVLESLRVKSLDLSVPRFLASLGMPGFSTKTAEKIFAIYPDLNQIRQLSADQLIQIDSIGETLAKGILSGLSRNCEVIDRLLTHVSLKEASTNSGTMSGIIFCFTGFRDRELSAAAQALGATESDSLTKRTTYLVTKDINSSSSKIVKAKSAGIKVISIDDFKALVTPK